MAAVAESINGLMLFVHLGAAYAVLSLWNDAPDDLQKAVLALVGMSCLFYAAANLIMLFDVEVDRALWRIASAIEHVAVLVAGFRLWYVEKDRCRKSLADCRRSGLSSKSSA
jgi:hypothetical protein